MHEGVLAVFPLCYFLAPSVTRLRPYPKDIMRQSDIQALPANRLIYIGLRWLIEDARDNSLLRRRDADVQIQVGDDWL